MLDWALPHLERHDTWFDLLAAGSLAQQRVLLLKGDQVAAHAAIDRIHAAAGRRGFDRLTWLVEGERARLLLAFGDIEQAMRYAETKGMGRKSVGLDRANDLAIHPRGTVPALLWTRVHLALGDFVSARGCLSQLIVRQVRKPNVPRAIELALLDVGLMVAERRQAKLPHGSATSSSVSRSQQGADF
jgi:LuxR family transcriptional regulator, maltose regulon positive regulatory protein